MSLREEKKSYRALNSASVGSPTVVRTRSVGRKPVEEGRRELVGVIGSGKVVRSLQAKGQGHTTVVITPSEGPDCVPFR